MARRKSSLLGDLLDLAAMLPPWLSLLLAIPVYAGLHYLSIREVPSPQGLDNAGPQVIAMMIKAFSSFLQYILPLIFVLGALSSYLRRGKRQALLSQAKAHGEAKELLALSWQEFELLMSAYFREQGYQVAETGKPGPDGGVDLVLSKEGERFLVQCKQWRARKVGVNIVRELYGVMAAEGATGGFVVTSGYFTSDAQAFASGRNIELLDGSQLVSLLKAVERLDGVTATNEQDILPCPSCGASMIKRTAKRGKNSGHQFWGCSTYPQCHGIRNLS